MASLHDMNAIDLVNGATAALYLVLAVAAWRRWERGVTGGLFLAALVGSAIWLAAAPASGWLGDPGLGRALDPMRMGLWLALLAQLHHDGLASARGETGRPSVAPSAAGALLGGTGLALLMAFGFSTSGWRFDLTAMGHLAMASVTLLLVESLMRQARADTLWRLKYLYIAIGLIATYDLFLHAESLLYHRLDAQWASLRGGLFAAAAPSWILAANRNPEWKIDLYVSRRAAVGTVALLGVGAYITMVAVSASVIGEIGGGWSRVLQASFLAGAGLLFGAILLSGTVRSRTTHAVQRAFFSHRYDYRDEWAEFVEALTSRGTGEALGARGLRAVMNLMDSPQGGLWLFEDAGARCIAKVGLRESLPMTVLEKGWLSALEARGASAVDLSAGEHLSLPVLELPGGFGRVDHPWLLQPLLHRDRVVGVLLLGRPRTDRDIDWEDRTLLELVGKPLASYLLEEQASRNLDEAERFAGLARRTAYIAHDVRNLSNELGLMLANARRHIENPEFQRDLISTMEASVARMNRLLTRLREEETDVEPRVTTDLVEAVRQVFRARSGGVPKLSWEEDPDGPLWIEADRDRLVGLAGHLIQNATDATGDEGRVRVRTRREGRFACLDVTDDGPGMEASRALDHLQHPFSSPAPSGFGIGLYQCRDIARSLGGELDLVTAPGEGTSARVRLPLIANESLDPGEEPDEPSDG